MDVHIQKCFGNICMWMYMYMYIVHKDVYIMNNHVYNTLHAKKKKEGRKEKKRCRPKKGALTTNTYNTTSTA